MTSKPHPWRIAAAITAFCALLVGALALVVHLADAQEPMIKPAKPLLAGHRGATGVADENTISAWRYALPYADILEADVRLTSDKKMVIMHDATLDRTTDCTGRVADRTLAYIKACDTPRRQHPPSLRQLLQWADAQPKQVGIYLELKGLWTQSQVQRFVNEIASYNFPAVTVSSFHPSNLTKVAVADDNLPDEWADRRILTALGETGDPTMDPFRLCDRYDSYQANIDYLKAAYVQILQVQCNPPTVVSVWGRLNTITEYERALATGAAVIGVEDAKHARRWLDSR